MKGVQRRLRRRLSVLLPPDVDAASVRVLNLVLHVELELDLIADKIHAADDTNMVVDAGTNERAHWGLARQRPVVDQRLKLSADRRHVVGATAQPSVLVAGHRSRPKDQPLAAFDGPHGSVVPRGGAGSACLKVGAGAACRKVDQRLPHGAGVYAYRPSFRQRTAESRRARGPCGWRR